MILLRLFAEFFKVSCFTFGGAYGAIALIRDMVLQNGWLSEEQLAYMIAVSESTPGPIMVNMATYIGSDQTGFWGSVIATVAVVLPAYLVILLVLGILKNTLKNPWVQAALRGLKPCVVGIVLATGLGMMVKNCFSSTGTDIQAAVITVALVLILALYQRFARKKLSPIALICLSAVLGIIVYGI